MKIQAAQQEWSRTTVRTLSVLLNTLGQDDAKMVGFGLPANALHLQERNLIVAGTPCDAPMFHDAMRKAADESGAEIVVAHHGLFPEAFNPVTFSVLVHISGRPHLFRDMVLYFHPADGYWLLPYETGPFMALEADGLRVEFEPPFVTFYERCTGVCEAAKRILIANTRGPF